MKSVKKQQTANDDTIARRKAIARWETDGGKVLTETKKPDRVRDDRPRRRR
jgi:hypothetical protein